MITVIFRAKALMPWIKEKKTGWLAAATEVVAPPAVATVDQRLFLVNVGRMMNS